MDYIIKNLCFRRGCFSLEADTVIPDGKLTTILGPSGSGKTTILQLLAGFLKPDNGAIFEGDRDLTGVSPKDRHLGMIFQDYALFPHLSVRENIAYGLKARKQENKTIRSSVEEMLSLMELTAMGDRRPADLSGGERQRVAIGRAMVMKPRLFLMDEPLSALDASLRDQLRARIRRVQRETGITTLYVTHDQQEALSLADYIVIMNKGRIIQSGDPQHVYHNPADVFTAGFLGQANLIPVKTGYDGAVFLPSGRTLTIPADDLKPETAYTLFFRPEDAAMGMDTEKKWELEGTVESSLFHGRDYEIRLKTPEGIVRFYNREGLPPLSGCKIRINRKRIRFLPV